MNKKIVRMSVKEVYEKWFEVLDRIIKDDIWVKFRWNDDEFILRHKS